MDLLYGKLWSCEKKNALCLLKILKNKINKKILYYQILELYLICILKKFQQVNALDTILSHSNIFVDMPNMTLTTSNPKHLTYHISFTGYCSNSISIIANIDGVDINSTELVTRGCYAENLVQFNYIHSKPLGNDIIIKIRWKTIGYYTSMVKNRILTIKGISNLY